MSSHALRETTFLQKYFLHIFYLRLQIEIKSRKICGWNNVFQIAICIWFYRLFHQVDIAVFCTASFGDSECGWLGTCTGVYGYCNRLQRELLRCPNLQLVLALPVFGIWGYRCFLLLHQGYADVEALFVILTSLRPGLASLFRCLPDALGLLLKLAEVSWNNLFYLTEQGQTSFVTGSASNLQNGTLNCCRCWIKSLRS